MKSILQKLDPAQFNITAREKRIFHEYHTIFKKEKLAPDISLLFANITFLLTNKSVLDYLLKCLDDDVKKSWDEEAKNPRAWLELHQPAKYLSYFGLLWPFPTAEMAENHSHHLLSKVLLQMEQRHGINISGDADAPVPTFVGYVLQNKAEKVLAKNQLWNEESKISALFYHGKMTHRIQFYLIMKAAELGMLDLGKFTVPDIIQLFIKTRAVNLLDDSVNNIAWNYMIDLVITNGNIVPKVLSTKSAILPIIRHFPPEINRCRNTSPYVYGCDPYYLNSYLMTVSRKNTPYLSECVTQTFCKNAFAIQRLEKEIGFHAGLKDYYIKKQNAASKYTLLDCNLTMEQVLKRQAMTFSTYGIHLLTASHIIKDRIANNKSGSSNTNIENFNTIEYRSIFGKNKTTSLPAAESEAKKRCVR